MTKKNVKLRRISTDPDDSPAWTKKALQRAELADGGKVLRPAKGTLTRPRGRPKLQDPKQQVSIRLDPDVLKAFRKMGQGWQGRMNDALREWLARKRA
jgi:uncharacterized protein (DUF4415 family)